MQNDKCICDGMDDGGQHYFQNRDLGEFISLQKTIQVLCTFLVVVCDKKLVTKKTLRQSFPVSQTRQEGKDSHIHAMKEYRRE